MGKPSITNIKPPSQTTVWTPSTSTWDLNNSTDWAEFKAHGWGADKIDGSAFTSLTDKLNVTEASAITVTHDDLQGYDYVFYGVNGGSDETIIGKINAAGILVSGNGKDHITGGGLGDQIWAGNGADVVHGGGGNDIIFGENGADQLFGDSDNGVATVTHLPGQDVLVAKAGAIEWDHDPNDESVPTNIAKATLAKEGVYVAVDANGHPTEFDGSGNPVVHEVYSFTPVVDDLYTIAYTHGSGLDGPGNPQFDGATPSDQTEVNLLAGNTYYFSFTYDPTHPTVQVDAFKGPVNVTGGPDDPKTIATSQAVPEVNWQALFTVNHTDAQTVLSAFTAGDELVGGNGPDTFTWDAADHNNVDLIWDYNSGSGTYDPTEGDKLVLKGVTLTDTNNDLVFDKHDLMTFSNVDLDGSGNTGLVVYVADNQAIGLVGITDINQVDTTFA